MRILACLVVMGVACSSPDRAEPATPAKVEPAPGTRRVVTVEEERTYSQPAAPPSCGAPQRCATACDAGQADACTGAGIFLSGSDVVAAEAFFRKGCDGKHLRGCFLLGTLLEHTRHDPAAAAAFYQQACDGGLPTGCASLGALYSVGAGVPLDLAKAIALWTRGCEAGDHLSCHNVAGWHRSGRGVTKDLVLAAREFEFACTRGLPPACLALASMVEAGEGTAKDPVRARALYKKACDGGDQRACAKK